MKHGQHAEQRVRGSEIDPVEHRFHLTQKVGVRKHHALGVGSGSGGVEQGSEVVCCRRCRLEFSPSTVENRGQVAQPAFMDGVLGHTVRVHKHEANVEVRNRLPRHLRVLRIAEQGRGAAILQQLGQLVGV